MSRVDMIIRFVGKNAVRPAAESLEAKLGNIKGLAIGLTGAFTAVAAAGVKAFVDTTRTGMEFESAMARVRGVTGGLADEEFQRLIDAAREVGATTGKTATEAAEALYYLGSAGLSASEQIDALGGTVALSEGEMIDLGRAAEMVTTTLAQFGLQASETDRVVNLLSATASASNTTVSQLGEAFTYAGPVAASFGMTVEETAGVLGVLANAGYKASLGGTALRGALVRLSSPTKEIREILESYGITLEDVNPATNDFADIIDTLRQRGVSASHMLKIFGQRAGPAMATLLKQGGQAIRDMTEAVTDTNTAYEKQATQMDNLEGDLKRMWSAWDELKIQLYDFIEGPGREIVQTITDMISGVSRLIEIYYTLTLETETAIEGQSQLAESNRSTVAAIRETWATLPGWVKGIFDALLDALITAMQGTFLAPAAMLLESFKEDLEAAFDFQAIMPKVQASMEAYQKLFMGADDATDTKAASPGDEARAAMARAAKAAQAWADRVTESSEFAASALAYDWGENSETAVALQFIEAEQQNVVTNFDDIGEKAGIAAGEVTTAFGEDSELYQTIKDFYDMASEASSHTWGEMVDDSWNAVMNIKRAWENQDWGAVFNNVWTAANAFLNAVRSGLEKMRKASDKAKEGHEEHATALGRLIKKGWEFTKGFVRSFIQSMAGVSEESQKARDILEDFPDTFEGFKKAVEDMDPALREKFLQALAEAVEGTGEDTESMGESFANLREDVIGTDGAITQMASEGGQKWTDFLTDLYESVRAFRGDAKEEWDGHRTDIVGDGDSVMVRFANGIEARFGDVKGKWQTGMDEIKSATTDAIGQSGDTSSDTILGAWGQFFEEVADLFAEKEGDFYDAGYNLGTQFGQGQLKALEDLLQEIETYLSRLRAIYQEWTSMMGSMGNWDFGGGTEGSMGAPPGTSAGGGWYWTPPPPPATGGTARPPGYLLAPSSETQETHVHLHLEGANMYGDSEGEAYVRRVVIPALTQALQEGYAGV